MSDRARADSPVVIVGGGPVGLLAALGLAQHGIETVVFETGPPDVTPDWRGSTIHPPTLEILDWIGLIDAPLNDGVRVDTIQYRDLELDDVVTFDLGVLVTRTRYPFRIQYEQYKLLRELRAACAASSEIELHYEHAVTNVDPGGPTRLATVEASAAGGATERVTAHWVVAADGSHSTVRKRLGVAMLGETYPTSSLVVATDVAFDELAPGLSPVSYWTGPHGRLSLIRTPDTWRIAITVGSAAAAEPAPESVPTGAVHPEFRRAARLLIGERDWTDLRQHQLYRSHQRVAETFNVGRVLLAGDAAHLSATTGGMGLNTGLHDAYEYVQALAPLIGAGVSDHEAAARVAGMRRDVALRQIQPATRAIRTSLDLTDVDERRQRLAALRLIADDPQQAIEFVAAASMLGAGPSATSN